MLVNSTRVGSLVSFTAFSSGSVLTVALQVEMERLFFENSSSTV